MTIIALMKCIGIKTYAARYKDKDVIAGSVELDCQYTSDESMREYCAATPSGNMTLTIENPVALTQIIPGKHYKITIEEIPITG